MPTEAQAPPWDGLVLLHDGLEDELTKSLKHAATLDTDTLEECLQRLGTMGREYAKHRGGDWRVVLGFDVCGPGDHCYLFAIQRRNNDEWMCALNGGLIFFSRTNDWSLHT